MVTPLYIMTEGFGHLCSAPGIENGQINRSAKIFTALVAFDMAVFITSLVIGALSATSVIHLSLSISYSLLGVSGFCLLSYGILITVGISLARVRKEKGEDGSLRLISRGVTDCFNVIPQVLKIRRSTASTEEWNDIYNSFN